MAKVRGFDEKLVPERNGNMNFFNPKTGEEVQLAIPYEFAVGFRHTFQVPVLDEFGEVTKETKKGSNGSWEATVLDFVDSFRCLGDEDVLAQNGKDPQNCVACRAISKHPKGYFKLPDRRFVAAVFVYHLDSKGNLKARFGGDVQIWNFNESNYREIATTLRKRFNNDGVENHDLWIKVIAQGFKNYQIQLLPDAAWQDDAESRDVTAQELADAGFTIDADGELIEESYKILDKALAKTLSEVEIEDKIAEVVSVWDSVGTPQDDQVSRAGKSAALNKGLDDLDNTSRRTSPGRTARTSPQDDDLDNVSRRSSRSSVKGRASAGSDDDGDETENDGPSRREQARTRRAVEDTEVAEAPAEDVEAKKAAAKAEFSAPKKSSVDLTSILDNLPAASK